MSPVIAFSSHDLRKEKLSAQMWDVFYPFAVKLPRRFDAPSKQQEK